MGKNHLADKGGDQSGIPRQPERHKWHTVCTRAVEERANGERRTQESKQKQQSKQEEQGEEGGREERVTTVPPGTRGAFLMLMAAQMAPEGATSDHQAYPTTAKWFG